MASIEQILEHARKLGQMVSEHDAAKKFEAVLSKLNDDTDAQRLLSDYNRQLETLSQKQAQGQPIEVEDKRKLETLQKQVVTHPLLRDLQMVQMDYIDLMRRVDEAMTGQTPGTTPGNAPGGEGASPLINPGFMGD